MCLTSVKNLESRITYKNFIGTRYISRHIPGGLIFLFFLILFKYSLMRIRHQRLSSSFPHVNQSMSHTKDDLMGGYNFFPRLY